MVAEVGFLEVVAGAGAGDAWVSEEVGFEAVSDVVDVDVAGV